MIRELPKPDWELVRFGS